MNNQQINSSCALKPPIGGFNFLNYTKYRILYSFFTITCILIIGCNGNKEKGELRINPPDVSGMFEAYKLQPDKRDSLHVVIRSLPDDSLKNQLMLDLSYLFYNTNDSVEFQMWNQETFRISKSLKDTLRLAEAHWDKGNFYFRNEVLDSSLFNYQKAYFFYKQQEDDLHAARMLLNIGIIQKNIMDFTGSEISIIRAISVIRSYDRPKQLHIGYNTLGIIFNELEDFETSLNYHFQALEQAEELNDAYLISTTLNNIGVVYINSEKYSNAIQTFNESLRNSELRTQEGRVYAMLRDNLAYAEFKENPQLDLWNDFEQALAIRDSINHQAGIVISKLHMAEYLLYKKDSLSAISYIEDAIVRAKVNDNYRDVLSGLLLLSRSDPKNAAVHLQNHIKLSDSLRREERAVRNKFERIRFETDEYIAQNEYLNRQRNWIVAGSTGILIMFSLLFVIRHQQSKNKKLKFREKQQKANEEIYKLLLDQESKIEDVKYKEKERISKELHDGILSKLFGIRFTLSHLNSKFDDESTKKKEKHLDDLRQIEQEIRLISHDLQKMHIEEIGFLKLLRKLLGDHALLLGFSPSLKADTSISWEKISNPVKMNLYRISQEAMQNVRKYSEASEAGIELKSEGEFLKIIIQDNGKGMDMEKNIRGIGLSNMKARTKEMGGSFAINSGNLGTIITIKIPI